MSFNINEEERDIFKEVLNTGMGRAAASLSEMLGHRIFLKTLVLEFLDQKGMKDYLQSLPDQEYVSVTQALSGPVTGKGVISFPLMKGKILADILLDQEFSEDAVLDASEMEAIEEVGNLLINSIGSAINEMTGVQIHYQLPQITLSKQMLSLEGSLEEDMFCVANTFFSIEEVDVEGSIVMVQSYESMERIIRCFDL